MYWAGKFGNGGLCFGAARRLCLGLVRAFGQRTASLGKAVSVWFVEVRLCAASLVGHGWER
jgi:hypothetical protein